MIRLIAAVDRRLGMAKHGGQPWSIPEDENFFTEETKKYGGFVLVGKTTFLTFGVPLAERKNYVLTHEDENFEGAEVVHDLDAFFHDMSSHDIWVIGGAGVFTQTLERADELYLTHIEADFGCELFFPNYKDTFKLAEQTEIREQNGFIYSYARYIKNEQ